MWRRLRLWFAYGLVVWVPLAVTVLALQLLYGFVQGIWTLLPARWRPGSLLHLGIPGLSFVAVLLLILCTGLVVHNVLGERLIGWFEKLINRIPFIRVVYGASKQIAASIFVGRHRAFEEAVLVPYPREGSYAIGFVTSQRALEARSGSEDLLSVYVPSTPNPTSGFLLMVPRRDLRPLGLGIEEAFRTLLTLGMTDLLTGIPVEPPPPEIPPSGSQDSS